MHKSRISARECRKPHVSGNPLCDRIICWDMDGTLGNFVPLPGQKPALRADINAALQILSNLGAVNVITTFASPKDAESAVKSHNISNISRIFGHDEMFSMKGNSLSKNYSKVAEHFGADFSSMIAVGNSFGRDMPGDGMVFIFEPEAVYYSAHVARIIIESLAVAGNGNFVQGFNTLLEKKQIRQSNYPAFTADLSLDKCPVVTVVES